MESNKIEELRILIDEIRQRSSPGYRFSMPKDCYERFNNLLDLNSSKDLAGKTLFISADVKILQSKLRDAGFKICRDISKADYIVTNNLNFKEWPTNSTNKEEVYAPTWRDKADFLNLLDRIEGFAALEYNPNFVTLKQVYKYIYKYEGNLELMKQIEELLKSNDDSNIQLAMEFMSNANWEDNEIYLQYLFYLYYHSHIRSHPYKNSTSFKGFLDSLSFSYKSLHLYDADSYRDLCKIDEHHQWVHRMFNDKFKEQFDDLTASYKIKVDEFRYSIDYGENTRLEVTINEN